MIEEAEFKYAWRFRNNPKLQSAYETLTPSETAGLAVRVRPILQNLGRDGAGDVRYHSCKVIEGADKSCVQRYLRSLRPGSRGRIYCFWPRDMIAIRMDYEEFIQYFDDVWYPSSDDLVVTDSEVSFLTYFDHEELIQHVVVSPAT